MENKGGGNKEKSEGRGKESKMEEESPAHEHISDYEEEDLSEEVEIVSCVDNCQTTAMRASTKI